MVVVKFCDQRGDWGDEVECGGEKNVLCKKS